MPGTPQAYLQSVVLAATVAALGWCMVVHRVRGRDAFPSERHDDDDDGHKIVASVVSKEAPESKKEVKEEDKGVNNDGRPRVRVGFVGNSIIYYNDLPRVFAALAAPSHCVAQQSCLRPGASLASVFERGNGMRGHFVAVKPPVTQEQNDPDDDEVVVGAPSVAALLARFRPQVVVLNDRTQAAARPRSLAAGIATLVDSYAPLFREAGAAPVLLQTYAYRRHAQGSDDLGATPVDFTAKLERGYAAYASALRRALTIKPEETTAVNGDARGQVVVHDAPQQKDDEQQRRHHHHHHHHRRGGPREKEEETRQKNGHNGQEEEEEASSDAAAASSSSSSSSARLRFPPRVARLGAAFATVHDERRELWARLFSVDDFHPSPSGTFLAACVLHCAVFDRAPARTGDWSDKAIAALWADARYMQAPGQPDLPLPDVDDASYLCDVATRVVLDRVVRGHDAPAPDAWRTSLVGEGVIPCTTRSE